MHGGGAHPPVQQNPSWSTVFRPHTRKSRTAALAATIFFLRQARNEGKFDLASNQSLMMGPCLVLTVSAEQPLSDYVVYIVVSTATRSHGLEFLFMGFIGRGLMTLSPVEFQNTKTPKIRYSTFSDFSDPLFLFFHHPASPEVSAPRSIAVALTGELPRCHRPGGLVVAQGIKQQPRTQTPRVAVEEPPH